MPSYYPLPDVPDEASEISVCVPVPNDKGHRAAFLGALYNLTRWYSWDRDGAGTGKIAADRWAGIFDAVAQAMAEDEGCTIVGLNDVRQNEETPCILEKQEETGGEWTQFADITLCLPTEGLLQNVLGEVPEGYDPTEGIPPPKDIPEGTEVSQRCYLSSNAAVVIKKTLDDIRNEFDRASDASSLVLILLAVVAGLLGFFWLALFVVGVLAALSISWEAFGEIFSDTQRDELICYLFCNSYMDEVDDFPSFDVDGVISDIQGNVGWASNSWGAAVVLIYIMGNKGLRNIGSLDTGYEYDCEAECACDECETIYRSWNFTIEDGVNCGWSGDTLSVNEAIWIDGVGYRGNVSGNYDRVTIKLELPEAMFIDQFIVTTTPCAGAAGGGSENYYWCSTPATPITGNKGFGNPTTGQTSFTFTINATVSSLSFYMERGGDTTDPIADIIGAELTE